MAKKKSPKQTDVCKTCQRRMGRLARNALQASKQKILAEIDLLEAHADAPETTEKEMTMVLEEILRRLGTLQWTAVESEQW